jgi:soluble calcium-activated nucleotidase 1
LVAKSAVTIEAVNFEEEALLPLELEAAMDIPKAPLSRSESIAYPRHHYGVLAKLQWYIRQNAKPVLATAAFLTFILIVSSDVLHDSNVGPGGAFRGTSGYIFNGGSHAFAGAARDGYFSVADSRINENVFRFAAVTDLDQLSNVKDSSKPKFRSVLLPGKIIYDREKNKYDLEMEPTRESITGHNEAGRGAEFSELTIFENRLLTFDDRTGEVFEILNTPDGKSSFVVPRFVVTEGDGDTDKGMKWEWSTVKNGELYMGSMGKEYTNPDGSIANTNNLWVSVLNSRGELRRIDWERQFTYVRKALGAQNPGYLIHEAINWSPHLRKWIFMPRRISYEKYDDVLDEKRGSNKVILVDEKFTSHQIVTVNMESKDGLHGFSSFAFIPGTGDKHVLALRSVEEDCAGDLDLCKQRSYFVIFDVTTGEVLMDERKIEEDMKYEGVEFVNMYTIPPQ